MDPTLEMSSSELARAVEPVDPAGSLGARIQARLDALLKPPGSLGRLEELALRIGLAQGRVQPTVVQRAVLIFAGDHGVYAEGVSAYDQTITAELCRAFGAGSGVIGPLSRGVGARLSVVDVGVDADLAGVPGVRDRKDGWGSQNMAIGPAMTVEEVEASIRAGAESVAELGGLDLLAIGEAGIGNTTSAAALTALLTGAPPERVVGRGTGVDDEGLRRKIGVVRGVVDGEGSRVEVSGKAMARLSPIEALARAGGFEFGAMTGAILAAAARRIPVVLDGYATGVAALLATRLTAAAQGYLIAAHRSAEPGHQIVLDELGLEPLLEWEMRLGEGSGAILAIPLAEAACRLLREVPTFEDVGAQRG